jgi:spore coat protein A, manganese oxidase
MLKLPILQAHGHIRARRTVAVAAVLMALALGFSLVACGEGSERSDEPRPPAGALDPTTIPQFQDPLVIPPAMPTTAVKQAPDGSEIDYYEIAMKQFDQYILPMKWSQDQGIGPTTVWSYASMTAPQPVADGGTLNYPALTIEARVDRPVRVKWINGLVDENGDYLPHLLPVDQTVHWANPAAGPGKTESHMMTTEPYTGPVPIVTHVHGAHTTEDSDGYPEAWYLPAAKNIPSGYATTGAVYEQYAREFEQRWGEKWEPGSALYQYPNDQREATLWYHDHALGMTRTNVYAGPAGFYLLRDETDHETGWDARLPGPAPQLGDAAGTTYREIPIAIQDRSFNADGSLFYPDNRAYFEGLSPDQLQIPFTPDKTPAGKTSDVAPIWNPEFFGDTIVVNGKTWPYLEVEPARYRFRFLNGSQTRFLILKTDRGLPFWQVGTEGGYLPKPVKLSQLLIAPAERADVVVDFAGLEPGTTVTLLNLGPDEPYGGGTPGKDFEPADPATTGKVMQFRVQAASEATTVADASTPPAKLPAYAFKPLGAAGTTRHVSLNEAESKVVRVPEEAEDGVLAYDPEGVPFGPTEALLGTFDPKTGEATQLEWRDRITENPKVGATEIWEIHNTTMDAHPIHIHLVQFQVVERRVDDPKMSPHGKLGKGATIAPEAWEYGYKDTVIVYPGETTLIKARFDTAGLFVWHCHILEHEDNEMMRPYRVGDGPLQVGSPEMLDIDPHGASPSPSASASPDSMNGM